MAAGHLAAAPAGDLSADDRSPLPPLPHSGLITGPPCAPCQGTPKSASGLARRLRGGGGAGGGGGHSAVFVEDTRKRKTSSEGASGGRSTDDIIQGALCREKKRKVGGWAGLGVGDMKEKLRELGVEERRISACIERAQRELLFPDHRERRPMRPGTLECTAQSRARWPL